MKKIETPPRLHLRTIVFAGLAVILTWLVVSRSVAAYLADVAPQTALWLNPWQPQALANLADRSLNASQTTNESRAATADQTPDEQKKYLSETTTNVTNNGSGYSRIFSNTFSAVDQNPSVDLPTVRDWAKSALTHEPLDARSLRVLGQVADAAKNQGDAWKFMQAAARLSLHETIAIYWLMRRSADAKDYKAATYYADVILRTSPQFAYYVVPTLAQIAGDKGSNAPLKTILASNPPWRDDFFATLPNTVTDARTPLDLLLALRPTSTPPTSADIGPYLKFLIGHKLYDLAYYTWLQFLPSEELRTAGLLFNGDFEVPPSGLPFDWIITPGSGVTIDIVPRGDKDGKNALLVDFQYGRVDYHSVSQLVMLPPGRYQFAGKYKGELVGPRGMKWRILCAGESTSPIGESSMISGIASGWKDVEFAFTVPSAGCRGQYVRLDLDARMASEQLVSGSILFSELQISRSLNPPADSTRP